MRSRGGCLVNVPGAARPASLARVFYLLVIFLLLASCADPRGPSVQPTAGTQTTSTSPPSVYPPSWRTYSDPDYGFSISHPPDFVVWSPIYRDEPTRPLKTIRLAAEEFAPETYADGGIGILVFPKDADDVESWVMKHSYFRAEEDGYFAEPTRLSSTSVAGEPAVEFDVAPASLWRRHHVAFFDGSVAVTIHWWSETPEYGAVVEAIWQDMLPTYRDSKEPVGG